MNNKIVLKSTNGDFQYKIEGDDDSTYKWLTGNIFHTIELPTPTSQLRLRSSQVIEKIIILGTNETFVPNDDNQSNIEYEVIDPRPETPSGVSVSAYVNEEVNITIPNSGEDILELKLSEPLQSALKIDIVDGKAVISGKADYGVEDQTVIVTLISEYGETSFPLGIQIDSDKPNVVPIEISAMYGEVVDIEFTNNGEPVLDFKINDFIPDLALIELSNNSVKVVGTMKGTDGTYETSVSYIGEYGIQESQIKFNIDVDSVNVLPFVFDVKVGDIVDFEIENISSDVNYIESCSSSHNLPVGVEFKRVGSRFAIVGTVTEEYPPRDVFLTFTSNKGAETTIKVNMRARANTNVRLDESYRALAFIDEQNEFIFDYYGNEAISIVTDPILENGFTLTIEATDNKLKLSGESSALSSHEDNYKITVKDSDGNESSSILNLDNQFRNPNLSSNVFPINAKQGEAMSVTLNNNKAYVTDIRATPSLPEGIRFYILSDGRVEIKGTPLEDTNGEQTEHTIKAFSEYGSQLIAGSFIISSNEPMLVEPYDILHAPLDGELDYKFTNNGEPISSVDFVPNLPNGISYELIDNTVRIFGTIEAEQDVTKYKVVATSGDYDNAITFDMDGTYFNPNVEIPTTDILLLRNVHTEIIMLNSGAKVTEFNVVPTLPDGLEIVNNSNDDVVLQGTANSIVQSFEYSIEMKTLKGSQSGTFRLEVRNENPVFYDNFSLNGTETDYFEKIFVNEASGSDVISISIQPELPSWATFELVDVNNIKISGTPDTDYSENYKITALSEYGKDEINFLLVISDEEPILETPLIHEGKGYEETTAFFVNSGGPVKTFTAQTLPNGYTASLQDGSIIVKGTATETLTETSFEFIGTNETGSSTAILKLSVNEWNPIVQEVWDIDDRNNIVLNETIQNDGVPITSISVSPELPEWLSLSIENDGGELTLSGTTLNNSYSKTHTITALSQNGSDTITLNIEIEMLSPLIVEPTEILITPRNSTAYTNTSYDMEGPDYSWNYVFVNNGADIVSIDSIEPSLTSSYSIDIANGTLVLSGLKDIDAYNQKSYTIEVSSASNDSQTIKFTADEQMFNVKTSAFVNTYGTNDLVVHDDLQKHMHFIKDNKMSYSMTNDGLEFKSYVSTPSLPDGIEIINDVYFVGFYPSPIGYGNMAYLKVVGTATEVTPLTRYKVDFISLHGELRTTVSFDLGVVENNPEFKLDSVYLDATINQELYEEYIYLEQSAAKVTSYDINPQLPSWATLSLVDDYTFKISGTPDGGNQVTTHTIKALYDDIYDYDSIILDDKSGTKTYGEDSITLTIDVKAETEAPNIPNAPIISSMYVDKKITPIVFINEGGYIDTVNASTLPNGLIGTIEGNNYVISGTPTSTQGSTSYGFTLTNEIGSTNVNISIEVGELVLSYKDDFGTSIASYPMYDDTNNINTSSVSLSEPIPRGTFEKDIFDDFLTFDGETNSLDLRGVNYSGVKAITFWSKLLSSSNNNETRTLIHGDEVPSPSNNNMRHVISMNAYETVFMSSNNYGVIEASPTSLKILYDDNESRKGWVLYYVEDPSSPDQTGTKVIKFKPDSKYDDTTTSIGSGTSDNVSLDCLASIGCGIYPDSDNTTGYFKGGIIEIEMHDRALTDDEFMSIYDKGVGSMVKKTDDIPSFAIPNFRDIEANAGESIYVEFIKLEGDAYLTTETPALPSGLSLSVVNGNVILEGDTNAIGETKHNIMIQSEDGYMCSLELDINIKS